MLLFSDIATVPRMCSRCRWEKRECKILVHVCLYARQTRKSKVNRKVVGGRYRFFFFFSFLSLFFSRIINFSLLSSESCNISIQTCEKITLLWCDKGFFSEFSFIKDKLLIKRRPEETNYKDDKFNCSYFFFA